jgi:hypothetical protein
MLKHETTAHTRPAKHAQNVLGSEGRCNTSDTGNKDSAHVSGRSPDQSTQLGHPSLLKAENCKCIERRSCLMLVPHGEFASCCDSSDRLCGLVVRVLGYRSGGPGSIPGTTKKKSSASGTGCTEPREYKVRSY